MTNPVHLLDPDVGAGLILPFEHLGPENLDEVRRGASFDLPATPGRSDHLVPGDPPVPIRVHRPPDHEGLLPCLYSMHGGGYVIGTYDIDSLTLDDLCPRLGIVGVTVDYRLAPETPYPGPLEDCYRGLKWTFDHAEELGIDPARIGVTGPSAGGGLAAALALLARDRGEPRLAFQLLDCPMLDDRQATRSSRRDGLLVWSRRSNEFGWRSYLGELYGADDVPYTAAPARATDLSGLPPAFVSVGSIDGFLDEDVDYALRLNHAGVPCELHVYPGAPHGYQIAFDAAITRQSRRDVEDWLRRQIEPAPPDVNLAPPEDVPS
ncbi:MAG TPA: alpha/beta hydrolase [Acidimicrobiales bacterium]|nr:alpha/beta hydrolase [Acidimicrobiales bacterium]